MTIETIDPAGRAKGSPGATPERVRGERMPREKRWAEILRVAAEVFHEKGYDAATLQDIADRVGILKGSIYYYIETKGDLLENLLVEVHNQGLAMIRQRAAMEGDVFHRMAGMIRGHIEYMESNQAKTVVYLHELSRLDTARRDALFPRHEFRAEFQRLIEEGQRAGLVLPELDPKLTAQMMLGCLNSIYHWFRPGYEKSAVALANHIIATQLRGIATIAGIEVLDRSVGGTNDE